MLRPWPRASCPILPRLRPTTSAHGTCRGYVTSYVSNEMMRYAMNEENIFGDGEKL